MDEYNEQKKGEVARGVFLYGFFTLRPHSTPYEGVEFIFQNPIKYTAVFSPRGISCFCFCLTFDSTASLLFIMIIFEIFLWLKFSQSFQLNRDSGDSTLSKEKKKECKQHFKSIQDLGAFRDLSNAS